MKNVLILLLLVLVSCGGNTPEPTPETFSIQITPGAALLTKTGETKALTAKVVNSSGNVVDKPITWTSSNPETVQISSDGVITAFKDVGSSQIVASIENQKSVPILVTVIETLPNTILLTDKQIVGEVVAVNPEINDIIKLEYDVVLTGLAMPEVGSIVLNSETKPVAGKVLSVQPVGNDFKVRLRGDAPGKLVKHFELNQTINLSGAKPELTPEIAALYDTSFQNGEYVFTPKPGAKPQAARVSTKGIIPKKIGPFECEFAYPYTPVTLGILPTFSIVFNPIVKYTSKSIDGEDKFARVEIGVEPVVKLQAQLTVNFDATLIVTCEATFFKVEVPIPAFLSLVATKVKAGVGFEILPKATLTNFGLKMALESKSRITFGLDCTNDCTTFSNFENLTPLADIAKFTPVLPETNSPVRIELTTSAYGFLNFGFGVPLIDSLGIDLIGISFGIKDEYNWTTLKSQMDATDYKSSHKDSLYAEASLGRKILGNPELKDEASKPLLSILNYMGIFRWNIAKVGFQKLIIDTPVATTLTTDVVTPLEAGKAYNFKISLDPKTATPLTYYGVDTISVYAYFNNEATKLTEVKANPDQVEFSLNWTVPANSSFVNSSPKFFAFVTQKGFTSFAELELGEFISAPTCIPKANEKYCVKVFDLDLPIRVNDKGDILGRNSPTSTISNTWGLWKNDQKINFENNFFPSGINNAGQVFGSLNGSPKVWQDGMYITLKNSLVESFAITGINDQGQTIANTGKIIGIGSSANTGGVIWNNFSSEPKFLKDESLDALSINNNGKVVGLIGFPIINGNISIRDIFLWSPSSLIILPRINDGGTPDNPFSIEINDSDQILVTKIKRINTTDNIQGSETFFTYIWINDAYIKVDSPSGALKDTIGRGFNNVGQIVGGYFNLNNRRRGFVWQNGAASNLTSLIDPTLKMIIYDAYDINNKGQIVTQCFDPSNPTIFKTCLLTPAQ
jgi:hypothetical protein